MTAKVGHYLGGMLTDQPMALGDLPGRNSTGGVAMNIRVGRFGWIAAALVLLSAATARPARAHCDSMDGPVVTAGQRALETGNINHALLWVRAADEPIIREAFTRALAVRKQSASARDLADLWFFETLVRVHREGEGAPYTGLKPAGTGENAAIGAADDALALGSVNAVEALLIHAVRDGLRERFAAALAKKKFDVDDVAAGRAYIHEYVPFIHYVEGIYNAARPAAHGHTAPTGSTPHP